MTTVELQRAVQDAIQSEQDTLKALEFYKKGMSLFEGTSWLCVLCFVFCVCVFVRVRESSLIRASA